MKKNTIAAKSIVTRENIAAFVASHPRASISEITRHVNLTRPTVTKHLQALEAQHALTRDESGKYSINKEQ